MKGKILGVSVELERMVNPEVAKRYEESIGEIMTQISDAQKCESGADGIRMQCEAVIHAFTDVFGEEKTKEILGEQTTLFRCLDAFDEYVNLYPEQITPLLIERAAKYSPDRLNGR